MNCITNINQLTNKDAIAPPLFHLVKKYDLLFENLLEIFHNVLYILPYRL